MRRILSLFVLLMLTTVLAFGQKRTVTGKVTESNGDPVSFASIKIKGTNVGVAADVTGAFKIDVADGAILEISGTGYVTKEVTVSGAIINVSIEKDKSKQELTTVVVTALGIKRSVKSTPFATQQISGDRLSQTRMPDLTTALAGKIAGVQVLGQADSKLGSSGTLRIRGAASFNERGAIYVVDGTILTNPADINFDDVATVNVLKGPNATALYGQRAEGGVVVITTKKAKKGSPLSVEVNQTTTFESVANLPNYQNTYGGGGEANWRTYTWTPGVSPVEWQGLNGKKYHDYTDDASWGPKIDGSEYIPWYAWVPGSKYSFKTASFTAQPNNVQDFYDNGVFVNNNISVAKAGEDYSVRVGFTNYIRNGIQPNSKQNKNTISGQLSYNIIKGLTISTDLQYTFEKVEGYFNDEYSNFTSGSFNQWFHRTTDMSIIKELRGLKTPNGNYASWNWRSNPGASTVLTSTAVNRANYWYNYYTYLDNLSSVSNRNRLAGNVALAYKINNDFKVQAAYRFNYRTTDGETKVPFIIESSGAQTGARNSYSNSNTKYNETNYEIIGSYNKTFGKFAIEGNVGGNILKINRADSARATTGGLVQKDVYSISNSVGAPAYGGSLYQQDKEVRSIFARGSVGYNDLLFFDFSLRRDWSSVFGNINENGYTTPSVGLTFVFSELTKSKLPALSFGKLRASYATVGSDNIDPYEIDLYYKDNPAKFGQNVLVGTPNQVVNPNVTYSLNQSFEAGVDLRFFKDRIGLSVTYFNEDRKNEPISTEVSATGGYTAYKTNVGLVNRQGVELSLDFTPVKSKNFQWDVTFNWSKVDVTVNEITPTLDILSLGGGDYNSASFSGIPLPGVVHVKGQRWGQLRGVGIKRINGIPVLSDDGTYVSQANTNFGSVLPNYTGGVFTSIRYKSWTLSAALDFQQGGSYFSLSDFWGTYSGLYAKTAAINDNGKNVRDDVSAGGGVHVFGVKEDGKPYDTYVDGYTYFHQFGNGGGIADLSVFEATYVKVREISLGYDINTSKLGSIGKFLKRASVSVVARAPFLLYSANPDIDPSQIAERYGENGQQPGTRQFGFNLKLGF